MFTRPSRPTFLLPLLSFASLALLAFSGCASPGTVATDRQWIDAWGVSYLPTTINNAPAMGVPTFDHQTVRLSFLAKVAGSQARVKFTNQYGTEPLVIGATHIALRTSGGAIDPATDRALTFNGAPSVTLAPGAEIWSDAADIHIPQLADVAVSVYVNQRLKPTGFHLLGLKPAYLSAAGNFADAATMPQSTSNPTTTNSLFFVSDLQVLAPTNTKVIVAFGDSITDGANSDPDTNTSWPDVLAQRLASGGGSSTYAVINLGIGSNRVVSADAAGPSGLHRFEKEALGRSNVTHIIVLEGINDISYENAPAEQIIGAYRQMIAQAHAKKIKIYGATLLPILNSRKYTPANEATRAAVNDWIRTAREFDAVIDFERVVQDPASPLSMRKDLTRDFVHPNSTGYKLLAESIDLNLLK
jgi:lysophospholipase L1-like esterase